MKSRDSVKHWMLRSDKGPAYMQIYSKFDRWQYANKFGFEVDVDWRIWYEHHLKCTGCEWPKRAWQENPKPLNVNLVGSFPGCVTNTLGCHAGLVHENLVEILGDYLPTVVWGQCFIGSSEKCKATPFLTCQVSAQEWANPNRGPGNRHAMCPDCGLVYCPYFGRQAFVEGNIQGRPIVLDNSGSLYIHEELATELKLVHRFYDDLQLFRIPVIPEPLDGWALPGDSGWSGVLRPPAGSALPGE